MRILGILALAILASVAGAKERPSLKGSRASVNRMAEQARLHKFDHMRDGAMVSKHVRAGRLVHVNNTENFVLDGGVTFPYARPATKLWLHRFSRQYRVACGEQLMVTSLLRPKKRRLWNGSRKSVHPTGMAVDLRIPRNPRCRSYLERNLLVMEGAEFLEATLEVSERAPHYHVAVYSRQYLKYIARKK